MNATHDAPADTPALAATPDVPPPLIGAGITESLRWIATVCDAAGSPDTIEIHTRGSQIWVTLRDESTMMAWVGTVRATLIGRTSDELGVAAWARTTDDTRWTVTLCATVREGHQQ